MGFGMERINPAKLGFFAEYQEKGRPNCRSAALLCLFLHRNQFQNRIFGLAAGLTLTSVRSFFRFYTFIIRLTNG